LGTQEAGLWTSNSPGQGEKTGDEQRAKGVGCLVQVIIVIGVCALAPFAKDCGTGIGRVIGRGIGRWAFRSSDRQQLPATWTPQSLADFSSQMNAEEMEQKLGVPMTAEEVLAMRRCMEAGFQKEYPQGPRQMAEAGKAGIQEAGSKIGMACGLEFQERFMATWSERSTPWWADQCTKTSKTKPTPSAEEKRFCTCLSKVAPRYYASPAKFTEVTFTEKEQRSREDQRKIDAIFRVCVR